VEVPNLGSSTVWNLNDHVSVVNQVKVSVVWKLGNNVEISFDVETESLIEFSLGWLSLPFINVDDIPLLVKFIGLFVDTDILVFTIKFTNDF